MWDDYYVFLIAFVYQAELDEIYYLTELPFDWLIDNVLFVYLVDDLIICFCYSNLTGKPVDLKSHRL